MKQTALEHDAEIMTNTGLEEQLSAASRRHQVWVTVAAGRAVESRELESCPMLTLIPGPAE